MFRTNITKEFKGKGFFDPSNKIFISSGSRDSGKTYDILNVFETIAKDGDEIEFVVRVKEQYEGIDEEE